MQRQGRQRGTEEASDVRQRSAQRSAVSCFAQFDLAAPHSAVRTSAASAFTLVELLVVITILAILASLMLFALAGAGNRHRNAHPQHHRQAEHHHHAEVRKLSHAAGYRSLHSGRNGSTKTATALQISGRRHYTNCNDSVEMPEMRFTDVENYQH